MEWVTMLQKLSDSPGRYILPLGFLSTLCPISLLSSLRLLKDFLLFQRYPLKFDHTSNVFRVLHWKQFWSRKMSKFWVSFLFKPLLSQRLGRIHFPYFNLPIMSSCSSKGIFWMQRGHALRKKCLNVTEMCLEVILCGD